MPRTESKITLENEIYKYLKLKFNILIRKRTFAVREFASLEDFTPIRAFEIIDGRFESDLKEIG